MILHVAAQPQSPLMRARIPSRVIGKTVPRVDIPAQGHRRRRLRPGPAPGRHGARARRAPAELRPPSSVSVDTGAVEAMPGVVAVVRDGSFLAVVAEREYQAVHGDARARRRRAVAAKAREPARAEPPSTTCMQRSSQPRSAPSPKQARRRCPTAERTLQRDLHPALPDARLDRAVLRRRADARATA